MHRVCFLLAIIAQNFIGGWSDSAACSLDVDNIIKTNQPVMVSSDKTGFSLASPEKKEKQSVINVPADSKIILVCPGLGNEVNKAHQNTVITTCNRRNELQIQKGKQTIAGTDKFFCTKPPTPEIRNTEQKCGENSSSKIYDIGFPADAINTWFQMYSVCHDALNMNTLYSTNTIDGKSIKARQKNVPRPPEFMQGNLPELYEGSSPNIYYFKKSQVEKFQKLFKPENTSNFFDVYYRFLSRGHLTPDADMAMSNWKIATYMYVNVAPQWQMINAGNWLRVENSVRDAAIWSQDDFEVTTGTYGVLKLHIGKQVHELYLAPHDRLKVPEQFWKIVYHKKSQNAIVIITSNNPYATVPQLCKDICKTYGWWHENFQENRNLRRGLTYCCAYHEFKNVITYAPVLVVKGIYAKPDEPPAPPVTSPLPRFRAAIKKVVKKAANTRWKKNAIGN